jgi:hypothetical protein
MSIFFSLKIQPNPSFQATGEKPPAPEFSRYVSRAALIFARTHAAPPSRLHFAHSSSVIRTGRARISSPSLAIGLRPWPRPAPPRLLSIPAPRTNCIRSNALCVFR